MAAVSKHDDARGMQMSYDDSIIRSVFATPDLLFNILHHLIDGESSLPIYSLAAVCKDFHRVTISNQFWQKICYVRWKTKWGFRARWRNAMMDYSRFIENQHQQTTQEENKSAANTINTNSNFWRSRYFLEEQDSKRKLIRAEELESMVFDFRFWIGQPTVVDGKIVVKSGLLQSASRQVRFTRPSNVVVGRLDEADVLTQTWSARGHLTGHPCDEDGIEWFLDEESGKVQWGFLPNLWPQGTVVRIASTWGWQIQNPNIVMRAIDEGPLIKPPTELIEQDEEKLSGIEQECIKNDIGDSLYKDLIDSLENVPLRAAPLVNGVRVFADVPRSWAGVFAADPRSTSEV